MKRFRTKSTELSHFKALVVFVFTIYGILIPLWFALHGNKLLGSNDQWTKIVVASRRVSRSHIKETGHFDLKAKGREKPKVPTKKHLARQKNGLKGRRHRTKKPPTLPKPLRSVYYWPLPPQPRSKVAQNSGRLLFMTWDHLCCQSVNCLRKFPLFPLLPSKKRFIRRLRLSQKTRLSGQRIAGLLKPPETGSYSVYMKCLSTCEFWLSDNEYPLGAKLLKKVVRGIPAEHGSNTNNSKSLIFKVSLQAGRAYFMDVLSTVYRYTKRPFEVLWKLPNRKTFVPITKEFLTGFQKNPESMTNVLKLYAHSPSVKLTSFLESIEEPGDDDEDYTILGGKTDLNMNFTFLDSKGRPIFINSRLGNDELFRLSYTNKSKITTSLRECAGRPLFSQNKTIKQYEGVWRTTFSSLFPGDRTDYMVCIGNRYPVDCKGNTVIPQESVLKLLKSLNKTLNYRNIKLEEMDQKNVTSDTKIHQLVRISEKLDKRNGSLLLLDLIVKYTKTNSTYYHSQYLYMEKKDSSLCLPRGYVIKWDATVNIVVVAKRQTKWLRHFLANMEKIYLNTKDKHINVIIAKYGNEDAELMEEFKSNQLPSIRTVSHRGVFNKKRAIQSAVKKINDQNSIIFLMDLHIILPDTIIQLIRKYTIQGHTVFNPVLFRLSHCGSPASSTKPARGFWETFGYGILGIYKSDWDKLGNVKTKTKKSKKGWGGEDWELLDRILSAGLDVQRLRVSNFYHFHHSKKGMWN